MIGGRCSTHNTKYISVYNSNIKTEWKRSVGTPGYTGILNVGRQMFIKIILTN